MCDDNIERLVPEHQSVFQQQQVHWVAEVDFASHANKQYVRKSYQTELRLSKDLQVETEVSKPDVSMKCTHSAVHSENHPTQADDCISTEKDIEKSGAESVLQPVQCIPLHRKNSKIPPEKPPRRRNIKAVAETKPAIGNAILTCGDNLLKLPSSSHGVKKTHHRSKSEDLLGMGMKSFGGPFHTGAVSQLVTQVNERLSDASHENTKSPDYMKSSVESNSSCRKEGHIPAVCINNVQNHKDLMKDLGNLFESKKKKSSESSESSCTTDGHGLSKNTYLASEQANTSDEIRISDVLICRTGSIARAERKTFSTFTDLSSEIGSPSDIKKSIFRSAEEESSLIEIKSLCDIAFDLKGGKGLYYESSSDCEEDPECFEEEIHLDKWWTASNDEGKIYYYEENSNQSKWRLPDDGGKSKQLTSSAHSVSSLPGDLSPQGRARALSEESRADMVASTRHEGFLHRTWFKKDSKNKRKNWANMYVRYIPGTYLEGSNGLLFLTRNKSWEDDKKTERFYLYTTSTVENGEKKTSRQNTICLNNGQGCELLLQADDGNLLKGWIDVLRQHDGMQLNSISEGEDKEGKEISEKLKKAASDDNLNADNKGIREKLRFLIKGRPSKAVLEKKGIYKEPVFGSVLTTLCSKDSTFVPLFVLKCINNIEKNEENLKTDGLYRISGNAAVIQKIRLEIEQRNYAILEEEKDVHNLAGALKLFFRELKEPLIPYVHYDLFIHATGAEYRKSGKQAELLGKAVRQLPRQHYDTLRQLLQHLKRVSEYEKVNRMCIMNLAIVFGPCVLWPETTSCQDIMTDVMLHHRVVEGLLHDFSHIFR